MSDSEKKPSKASSESKVISPWATRRFTAKEAYLQATAGGTKNLAKNSPAMPKSWRGRKIEDFL